MIEMGPGVGKAGADIDLKSPLHEACSGGHLPLVKYLCEAGAKTNIRVLEYAGTGELTPLETARLQNTRAIGAEKKRYLKIIGYLSKKS